MSEQPKLIPDPPLFYFVGDLHLAAGAWRSMPGVRGDAYASFRQIVDEAVKEKPLFVVLGGDVFDARTPPPDACHVFIAGCAALEAAGVRVAFIQGQHERSSARDPDDPKKTMPWCSALWPGCLWMEKGGYRGTKLDGKRKDSPRLAGCDNRPGAEMQEWLGKVPENVDVLILHQSLKGVGGGDWDLDPAWVPPTVQLVLLGDIHIPYEETVGTTRFVYSGSTAMHSVDEPLDKSFLKVMPDLSVVRAPLKTRPFLELSVRSRADLAAAVEKLKAAAPETVCAVRFDATVPGVEEALKEAGDRHLRLMPDPLPELTLPAVPSAATCASGAIDELEPVEARPVENSLAHRLLDAEDPEGALDVWVRDRLEPPPKEPEAPKEVPEEEPVRNRPAPAVRSDGTPIPW